MDSERLDELVNWWDKNYECIFDQDVLEKVKLGTKNTSCRFCRRSYPEVKFRSTAHALPEFLNNDKLVNLNECDGCNNLFGRTIEDNLASYLAPFRIASTISGRKSTFTYKLDELNRIDIKEGHIEIKESTQGNLLKIIDEHNVELKVRRPKYIPIMAYKALVKMAVSIIPDSEIEN